MALTSVINNTQQLYSVNGVVISSPVTQVAQRAPTVNDRYRVGTSWIDESQLDAYVLCGYTNGQAQWINTAGGGGMFANLTVNPGPINLTGVTTIVGNTSINATGAGTTTIGSAAGGAVIIDSTASVNISGDAQSSFETSDVGADLILRAVLGSVVITGGEGAVDAVQINASGVGGGIDINATAGGVTVDTTAGISLDAVTASNFTVTGAADLTLASTNTVATAVTINANTAAGSGITANVGATGLFNVAGGDINITGAEKGIILTDNNANHPKIVSYNGDPNNNVLAPQGSLCLNTAGVTGSTIAYVNTNGTNTGWVPLTA